LRAGAALFSSIDEVRPQLFSQFVAELRLDVEYRGAEGIGWAEVVEPQDVDAFIARNRAAETGLTRIWPESSDPERKRAPVTYFAPESERNSRALGLDLYSDPVRSAALDEASRTVRPTASGRVTLAQDLAGTAPGFMITMPVYRDADDGKRLAGFIYAPFDANAFLDAAVEFADTDGLGVRLYDGAAIEKNLMVRHGSQDTFTAQVEEPIMIANRELTLVIETRGDKFLAPLSMVTMLFGLAVASLLMLLARLLATQAREDQTRLAFFEEQNSIRNSLTRELNHRVKNTLANVLSIMSLTRRRTDNLNEFADSLEGRIRALSATHDLLTHSDWGTIPVAAVIEAELRHFRAGKEHKITMVGPEVELAPNDALSFGLAMHELATNAAKYGALSVADGEVAISWTLIQPDLAEVEWCEHGGPLVAETRSRGFGTDLIEKIVAHELRNPVQLEFKREGVRCVMRVPVRRMNDFKIRQK
jgi:two-component sensor histidine kinase